MDSWEYNAPQFFDFNAPQDEDDQADEWFDIVAEQENGGIPEKFEAGSPTTGTESASDTAEDSAYVSRIESLCNTQSPAERTRSALKRNRQPNRDSLTIDGEKRGTPTAKRMKISAAVSPVNAKPPRAGTRSSKRTATLKAIKNKSSRVPVKQRSHGPQKLTIPSTPPMLKRAVPKTFVGKSKSTEELEMERIENQRKEAERIKKNAQASYAKAMTSKGYVLPVSNVPLTKPTSFNFQTDNRVKDHPMETRSDISKDFAHSLRHNISQTGNNKAQHGITIPKPFHLHESKKKPEAKYKSMAEQVSSFQSKTPTRFRGKSSKANPTPPRGHRKAKLTVPKTPNFESKKRHRPAHVMSQVEKEEAEIEESKQNQFKARPVDPSVFKEPVLKKIHKEPTKPVAFDLECERRPVKTVHEEEEEKFEFHAQPVPTAILERPIGVKPVSAAPVTIPQSPAFRLKNRLRSVLENSTEKEEEIEKEKSVLRAHPVPHQGVVFEPKLSHKVTEPVPFSFDSRDKEKKQHKEEKIKQMIEEEKKKREFHAQPLPDMEPDILPEKSSKSVTRPEPFHLHSEERGAVKADEWRRKMDELLNEQRATANHFKAKPATVVHQEPFVPKKEAKPLLEISDFELNTERRAKEREELDKIKMEKELEKEQRDAEIRVRKEQEENEMIAKLRAETVHKSNPVRHYRPVSIKNSDKPLTEPESPRFSNRLRLRTENH